MGASPSSFRPRRPRGSRTRCAWSPGRLGSMPATTTCRRPVASCGGARTGDPLWRLGAAAGSLTRHAPGHRRIHRPRRPRSRGPRGGARRMRGGAREDGPRVHRQREAGVRRRDGRIPGAQLHPGAEPIPGREAQVQLLEVRAPRRASHRRRRLRTGEVSRGHPRVQRVHPRPPVRGGRRRLRPVTHRGDHVRRDPRLVSHAGRGGTRPGGRRRRLQGAQELPGGLSGVEGRRQDRRACSPTSSAGS